MTNFGYGPIVRMSLAKMVMATPSAFPLAFDALHLWAEGLANGAPLHAEQPRSASEGIGWEDRGDGWGAYWGGYWWWTQPGEWRGVYLVYQSGAGLSAHPPEDHLIVASDHVYSIRIEEWQGGIPEDGWQRVGSTPIVVWAAKLLVLPLPLGDGGQP